MGWKESFKAWMKTMKPEEKAQFKKATEKMFEDEVEDLWSNEDASMHKVPGKEVINFGPGESASGKGAEVMVDTYSHPAPQQAITGEYEKLAREMGRGFAEARKAVARLSKNQEAIKEVLGFLLKSEEEDEEKEERSHEKAKAHMKKAKLALRKAESAEDEDEKEDGKDEVEKARINLKKAKELLFKAEEEGEDEDEVEKSFRDHKSLSKKLREVESFIKESFKDWAEEEEKEPEHKKSEEEKKKEEKVEKTEGEEKGDKGDQAGKPSKDGNQDDAAAKSEDIKKTVTEMFDQLMAQSRGGVPNFTIAAKADPLAFVKSKRQALENAILEDDLDLDEQGSADSIIIAMEKAVRGELDQHIVNEKIRKAPAKVQSLFA